MSGFVAMVNRDGSPIDARLLHRMTEYLRFRGPDDCGVEVAGPVGLGHALLRVTDESTHEHQPFTLDGRRWIVADARVDAREALIAALRDRDRQPIRADALDAELILRAYSTWGHDCVAHLLGDFAFAVWDGVERRLVCARDHLGVKPLFYAQIGPAMVVSNTLECVRLHPRLSCELNESAVADFLLFGINQDHSTTTIRDIQRLPPAHCLTVSDDTVSRRRYWSLPIAEPIVYRRTDEYQERFTALLRTSIRDRLRTNRVGVLMSGGVDSTTLAAVARDLVGDASGDGEVRAITSVYDRLVPDDERHYATLAARHLNIPIHYDVRDDEISIADWDRVRVHTPEPVANPPAFAAGIAFLRHTATEGQVLLYGEGPDDALRYEWRAYLSHLLTHRRPGALLRALWLDVSMHRRIPLRTSIGRLLTPGNHRNARDVFPPWLNDGFAARTDCVQRWEAGRRRSSSRHRVRPVAYDVFHHARWQALFEDCDINGALSHTEIRHPFVDVRLLEYLLALPAMPWCRNKLIIRRAMRTVLPREVLRRRKTALRTSPDFVRMRTSGMPRLVASPHLATYVKADKVPPEPRTEIELRSALRVHGLNYWFRERGN
ncbi:MAG TPA: asparagine synthase-related protein [Vicinamibacterales bacterium]|jgi:asparagine synthase (glutamine-hydrolysing)|nr:asparagine synthase-related protein [Vicinamibacterales bacterium]